jgi:hypothetical protein
LNTELNKAEQELEKTLKDNPNHLGTIYRLESRIEGLISLSAYKRWLLNNELDEVELDDSIISIGFSDEADKYLLTKIAVGTNGISQIIKTYDDKILLLMIPIYSTNQ